MSAIPTEVLSIEVDSLLTHVGVLVLIEAVSTLTTGIANGADSHQVSYLVSGHLLADHSDLAHYLVAWAARVDLLTLIRLSLPHFCLAWSTSEWQRDVCKTLSLTSVGSKGKNLKGY